ncbi:ATP-dependent helicase [Hazenella sp. IB182357]|uniref:DNA 3'-5' helicase n=1 Tax=Polycladospora coralii TaxID=2771432 RepID=A0A926RWM1_9BACL|nr:ATP-dependent helicase [Polycladospora coralii]MBD1371656.1 ATP-dependent helicase [Polycladospora coralii]
MDASSMILADLNQEQAQAVVADGGPVVVFAGPGSGKTTVLTRRVLYLLAQGVPADQLMIVTFTRDAANEMKARLLQISPKQIHQIWIGTFHALFLKMLRTAGIMVPTLASGFKQNEWIRQLLAQNELPNDDEQVAMFMNQIGLCKGNGILPEQLQVKKEKNRIFKKIYLGYEQLKQQHRYWDFDDILMATYHLLDDKKVRIYWQERFQHILVDEFQDINQIQYDILLRLSQHDQQLFVVGDDDQSIYGFRGSHPRFMLQLEQDFNSVSKVVLETNYRSTDEIIAVSDRLITKNKHRAQKRRAGTGIQGAPIKWLSPQDEEEEAIQMIEQLRDGMHTGILYRTSTQARALVDACIRKEIPFSIAEGDRIFYTRFQVQDILAYLRLSMNGNDLDALAQIVNKPKRYLYQSDWLDACWRMARKQQVSLIEVLPQLPGLESYQKKHMKTLQEQLLRIPLMCAEEAVAYICEEIGYFRYLESFAQRTGNDVATLKEPIEELLLAARHHQDGQALLAHIEHVKKVIQNQPHDPVVHLMTFHKAKGLEFDRVFLMGLHAMVLPHRRSLNVAEHRKNEAWEEERRLLYVGMTRAKTELYLSVSQMRQGKKIGPSPFLKEIGYQEASPSVMKQQVMKPTRTTPNRTQSQPHLKFIDEVVDPEMKLHHFKFGEGLVLKVMPMEGVAPGRKVMIRFTHGVTELHYELSRQLGLLTLVKEATSSVSHG